MPIVYVTTNKINGKKYLGKCVHNKEFYLGSGVALRKAIEKYGKENFSKEIIFESASKDEVSEKEYELSILYDVCNDSNWYNMKLGGNGGSKKGRIVSDYTRQLISKNKKGTSPWNKGLIGDKRTKLSDTTKEKIRAANKGQKNPSGKDHPCSKKVIFSKDGVCYEVKGIREFCREKSISFSNIIWRLRNGKFDLPTKEGWTVRYAK